MKKFNVEIPLSGSIWYQVEASSEEEAIDKAFEVDWSIRFESENECDLVELNLLRHVVEGNVSYATLNDAYAEES